MAEEGDETDADQQAGEALPDCNELFVRFFVPWYDDAARERHIVTTVAGDMVTLPSPAGVPPDDPQVLAPQGQEQVAGFIASVRAAAIADFQKYLPVTGDEPTIEWIAAFDAHYDRPRIRAVIDRSDPADFSNDYLVICCEFGTLIADVMLRSDSSLCWLYDWPYWESAVYDPASGTRVPVFHWAIKKMSEYGVDDGFLAKVCVCLEILARERKAR